MLEGVNGANGAVGPVLELSGSIPEDGVWVVADLTGEGLSFVAEADLFLNFDFQNGPDSSVTRDSTYVQGWRKTSRAEGLREWGDSREVH